MSNFSTPEPPPPQNRDSDSDNWIAIIVTLLAFAAIFYFAWSRGNGRFKFANLPGLLTAPAATPTPVSRVNSLTPFGAIENRGNNQATTTERSPQTSPSLTSEQLPSTQASPIPALSAPGLPSAQATPIVVLPVPGLPSAQATPTPEASQTPPASQKQTPTVAAPGSPLQFKDLPQNNWASPFVESLSARGVIAGLPDGTFKPNQPVTRGELASNIQRAFDKTSQRESLNFKDIPPNYWAKSAVDQAVKTKFMSGYPQGDFRPTRPISRLELLVTLATGLDLKPSTNPDAVLNAYQDQAQIPNWAKEKIAAATQAGLVTSYPNTKLLNPEQSATRADVATMIYQALVMEKRVEPIQSQYIVSP